MPDRDDSLTGAAERFAAAVERPAQAAEPTDAQFARELEIVAALRTLGAPAREGGGRTWSADPVVMADLATVVEARVRARVMAALADDQPPRTSPDPGPRPTTRARAGSRLLAGPGSGSPQAPNAVRTRRRRRRHALPTRRAARPGTTAPGVARRAAVVGAAALVVAITVAASGILVSRDAVPGDPLYGVKRAAEDAGGIFAAGDGGQARRDLRLAATRVEEIERMARVPPDPALLQSALRDLGASTAAGTRLALTQPADGQDEQGVLDLVAWTSTQTARLSAVRATLPLSTQPAVDDVLRLLERVRGRARALAARAGCATVDAHAVDDIGPLPATGPCAGPPSQARSGDTTTAGSDPAPADPRSADPVRPSPGSDPEAASDADRTTVSDATSPTATPAASGATPASRPLPTGQADDSATPIDPAGAAPDGTGSAGTESVGTTGAAPTSRSGAGPSILPFPFPESLLPGRK